MILLGLLFLLTGLIMNVRVLTGPYRGKLTSGEIMRTPPWMISVGLIIVGILLLLVGGSHGS